MKLTSSQKLASSHVGGNALVLAGPGTGKTATLVERCKLLVNKGVSLDSLFITTFTQKAANEIKNRIVKSSLSEQFHSDSDKIISSAYIGTFHSLCARTLKQFPGDAWLPYDFNIIGEDEQKKFLNEIGHEWDEDEGNFLELIAKWKDSLINPELAMQNASQLGSKFFTKAAVAYRDYEEAKKSKSLVDFSDLIIKTTELLRSDNDASKWFHDRFSHFIVDEFQDVNKSQIEFLKAALGDFGTIWAVADEDQSLYEWRGSNPSYCLNFSKIFKNSKIYQLKNNFRSPPLIINMSQAVIKNNRERYQKILTPAKKKTPNDFVVFKGFENEIEEAKWIAKSINNYKNNNIPYNDIAILLRSSNIMTPLQRALEIDGIPFSLNGTQSFWDLNEVKMFFDSVALLNAEQKFIDKRHLGNTLIAKKLHTLIEEMRGEHLRSYANAVCNILFEYIPKNLDSERRQLWMQSIQTCLNLALDFDDGESLLTYYKEKKSETKNKKHDSVNISTLHASKGLEWPFVIMIGVEEENLPHYKSNNLEEERRLFYVGVTRAKRGLTVTYSNIRNNKSRRVSRFLLESKVGANKELGKFIWQDSNKSPNREIDKQEKEVINKSIQRKETQKKFRHKGGKSLIPPEERGN